MRRTLPALAAVAAAVIALDRWTKHWVSSTQPFNQPIRVIGDYVRLTYTRNSGVAFGIGQGTGFPYYLFSLAAIVVIVWLFLRGRAGHGVARPLALALILGGAIGNLIDRVTSGEVVDFIEVGIPRWHWPVFNVADSAVSVGVVLFALLWTRQPAPGAPAPAPDDAAPLPGTRDEPARSDGPGLERR